MKHGVYSVVK